MKYAKQIAKVESGTMNRTELSKLKQNAKTKLKQGEEDAKYVIDSINQASPSDSYILFMGFCPNADLENRLDIEWKEKGICTFQYYESETQEDRFNKVCKGDLVVLKKIQQYGKTMRLYGHGRVKKISYYENNKRYLEMDWSNQEEVIEVPLMGANATVNIKSIEIVEEAMPEEFFDWLYCEELAVN